ncbi:YbaN family protein [Salipiger marinus]|uniref:YbaN family protein n=1 Tax=Salipiger marinus TaxID=555512 RepID=UPI001E6010A4|nr:YbaN family protein [Salipiger manganoxidans]MCD1619632.1 YbaN family protein [Salipiger manganoxidans]MEB3419404.1 YbaN family protein [Salipiger manganoxidans]
MPRPVAALRVFWFSVGALALLLGVIGVVLPVLPTTPFVILAAFAFGRSSPALQRRLEQSPTFGPMIADWRAHGAIAPKYKAMALTMMAAALGLSVAMGLALHLLAIQTICIAGAATFILTRPNGPQPHRHD